MKPGQSRDGTECRAPFEIPRPVREAYAGQYRGGAGDPAVRGGMKGLAFRRLSFGCLCKRRSVQPHRDHEGEWPGTLYVLMIFIHQTAPRGNRGGLRTASPVQYRPACLVLLFLDPSVVLTIASPRRRPSARTRWRPVGQFYFASVEKT